MKGMINMQRITQRLLVVTLVLNLAITFCPITKTGTVNAASKIKAPSSLSGTATSNNISLKWGKVAGTKTYYVYRAGKKIATVKGTSFIDKKVKKNKVYAYQVKAKNGSKSWKIKVKANAKYGNVKKVTLNTSELTLYTNNDNVKKLKVGLSPSKNLVSKKITWHSSNNGVAKVSANGKITAISPGKAVITARTVNGLQKTCKVIVKQTIADRIITNGKIYTANEKKPLVEAVAIKDGTFIYVGDAGTAELNAMKGEHTKIQDLNGKMATPSMIDAHTHPEAVAADTCINIKWSYDIDSIVAECKEYIEDHKQNYYEFRYYPSDILSENPGVKTLTSDMLEDLGDVPVRLYDFSDHIWWFNNKAMKLMGIDKNTPQCTGAGKICRYGDYYSDAECASLKHDPMDPTGVIQEKIAINDYLPNLYAVVGEPSDQLTEEQWENLIDYYHSVGVTAIGDAYTTCDENIKTLYEMDQRGNLDTYFDINVKGYYDTFDETVAKIEELSAKYTTKHIKIDTFKFFLDGSNESGTTSVVEPFEEETSIKEGYDADYKGLQNATTEEMTEMMLKLNRKGLDLQIHVCGDGGFRSCCDAVEAAQAECQKEGVDWISQVELLHCEIIHKDDKSRPAELGIIVNWSPHWTGGYFGDAAKEWLGQSRFDSMYNFQPVIKAGAVVTMSSDVVSQYEFHRASPVFGMQVGITRVDPEFPLDANDYPGAMRPLASSKFTMDQMIKAYSINGAIQLRIDDVSGSIEVGKNADMTVWKSNLYNVDPMKLSKVKVKETIFNGDIVYKD